MIFPWLRSALFYLVLVILTVLLGLLGLPFVLTGATSVVVGIASFWAKGVLWSLRILCGVSWRIQGLEHVPEGSVIFAAQHQSAWETLAFHMLFPNPAFVMKRELLHLPVIGSYLKAVKQIPIEPGSSGWQITLKMDLLLEGYRPKRVVRLYPAAWKVIALPREEQFFGRE